MSSVKRGGDGGKRQPLTIGPYQQLVACYCPVHLWSACAVHAVRPKTYVCLQCATEKLAPTVQPIPLVPIDNPPATGYNVGE